MEPVSARRPRVRFTGDLGGSAVSSVRKPLVLPEIEYATQAMRLVPAQRAGEPAVRPVVARRWDPLVWAVIGGLPLLLLVLSLTVHLD
jgi:hypothetical protein